jgi:DNA-binding beta-propeller fold protein YncE
MCRWTSSLLIGLYICLPLQAHADGGAPNLAYVSGTAQGISIIDVELGKVVAHIPLEGDPHTILLSLDGSTLYVTQPTLGQVSIIATSTRRTICKVSLPGKPSFLAFDQPSHMLYAAGKEAARISAIDPKTCAIQHTFEVNSPVFGLTIAPASNGIASEKPSQLWVSGTHALTLFAIKTGQMLAQIPISGGPQYLTASPGSTVYATTHQGDIYAIDLKTHVTRQLLTGGSFGPMDYDALTGEIYVPDQQNKRLVVLSPVDLTATNLPRQPNRVIATDISPETIAITSDGQLGFVAFSNGTVMLLDVPARVFDYRVTVGGSPHFIITGLYPPLPDEPSSPSLQEQQEQKPFWHLLPNWAIIAIFVVYILVIVSLVIIFVLLFRRMLRERQQR